MKPSDTPRMARLPSIICATLLAGSTGLVLSGCSSADGGGSGNPSLCGNGVLETGEACDDGNTITETRCLAGQATCQSCGASCDVFAVLTNQPPQITRSGSAVTIEGDVAVDTTFSITDPEGDDVSLGIVGGADGARFTFDASPGELRFVQPQAWGDDADGDGTYEVEVQAADAFGSTRELVQVSLFRMSVAPGLTAFEHNLALYAIAREVSYRCDIVGDDTGGAGPYDLGPVFFEYGTGARYVDASTLRFYPVGPVRASGNECQDFARSGAGTSDSQACVFFTSSFANWSMSFGTSTSVTRLPFETTQTLTTTSCGSGLRPGVTQAMCEARYTCRAQLVQPSPQTMLPRDTLLAAYLQAMDSSYACHVVYGTVDYGHVYFRYGYGAEQGGTDYLYFYPVQGDCTSAATGPVPTTGRQTCIFYADWMGRWSLYLGRPTTFPGGELPAVLTQSIATNYDCDNLALASGITPEICKAAYTCTLFPDP